MKKTQKSCQKKENFEEKKRQKKAKFLSRFILPNHYLKANTQQQQL